MNTLQKRLYWLAGILLAILGVIFTEGSLIATTKLFGIIKATLIRVSFTIPLSWLAIFLCAKTNASARVRNWLLEKQARLSDKARLALKGGEFFVILNATIFLGPIIASILMVMLGIRGKKIYLYAVLCALLCAWVWCCFYGGVCWSVTKFLTL